MSAPAVAERRTLTGRLFSLPGAGLFQRLAVVVGWGFTVALAVGLRRT